MAAIPPVPPDPVVLLDADEVLPPAPVVVSAGPQAVAPRADKPSKKPSVRFMMVLEVHGRRSGALPLRGPGRARVVSARRVDFFSGSSGDLREEHEEALRLDLAHLVFVIEEDHL